MEIIGYYYRYWCDKNRERIGRKGLFFFTDLFTTNITVFKNSLDYEARRFYREHYSKIKLSLSVSVVV